ncbi:MAG: polysaccharide deacetylase family protein, partial [Gemmatimonadales bacterium]
MEHHFTVDVEEYFQVTALEPQVARGDWHRWDSRVEPAVDRLLDLLARHEARATFFVLGWVADRHPALVRTIAAAGHEIASHGWDHRRIPHQTPDEFRASVRRTKHMLEDAVGAAVAGFRAPSFSIVRGAEWALDVLIEEGYAYDSSLFPVFRRSYGYRRGRRDPHIVRGGLIEV